MTYQPPPPPPSGPPAKFDPKTVNPLDWGIIGAGVLAFLFSFISYYTISADFGGGASVSESYSAWHGFFGWFAMFCALAGSAIVATALFAPQVQLPFAARLGGLIAYAVGTLSVILAIFVIPDGGASDFAGVDSGHGFGFWVSLVVIIAGLVLSLIRFQSTGGELPGALGAKVPNVASYDKHGAGHPAPNPGPHPGPQPGGTPPPPPAGGTPPPPPGYGPPR